jgi:hypothetical protein
MSGCFESIENYEIPSLFHHNSTEGNPFLQESSLQDIETRDCSFQEFKTYGDNRNKLTKLKKLNMV